ncbi:MAG: triphosphoribosyl-dephospho-CoA synthase [Methanothrix sp.]|nr:triphosphoribosyl-dephospho-CoA synthase [Methanothrix sp.]
MSPDLIAQSAQLAMLIELQSSPKPGNVDRCHDFSEVGFHHFVTSAVSAYPAFRSAASGKGSIGLLILEAVSGWRQWNLRSNTHFGSLVLMIPLAMAAGRPGDLRSELASVLRSSTAQDAIDFHRAFQIAGARVADVEEFSLHSPAFEEHILKRKRTLYGLMLLSRDHDLIAEEWATDYERSFGLAGRLAELIGMYGLNDGVVRTYLEALSDVPDTLVQAKFGRKKAEWVSRRALEALGDPTLESARRMDRELLEADINPGSTADLISAALFICILRGLRL